MFQEFSFHLHTLNLGSDARTGTNPFTGESVAFPVDEGLTDDQIGAVQDVLDEHGFDGPEPDQEGYALYGDDGSYIKFRCMDLEAGDPICNVPVELVIPKLTKEILSIVRDVARAGGFALTSFTGEDARLIAKSPASAHTERWPGISTLKSMSELRDWLEKTIGYRKIKQ